MSSFSQPETSGVQGSDSGMQNFFVSFGPGLLWAGSAIGVSHLVQSTRAGATAGFALAGVIIFALILKYPFFEFGPRYAAATGEENALRQSSANCNSYDSNLAVHDYNSPP